MRLEGIRDIWLLNRRNLHIAVDRDVSMLGPRRGIVPELLVHGSCDGNGIIS